MKSLCLSLPLLQLASASFSILQAYDVTLLFLQHLLVILRPRNTQVHIKLFSPHKSPCFSNAYSWRFHYTECPLEGAFHFSKHPPKPSWQLHNTLGNVPSKYTRKFSIRFSENNTHLKILEVAEMCLHEELKSLCHCLLLYKVVHLIWISCWNHTPALLPSSKYIEDWLSHISIWGGPCD